MQKPTTLISLLSLINLTLAGCAGTKEAVLPQDGPSMKTIYEQHVRTLGTQDPLAVRAALKNRPLSEDDGDLQGYTRDADNELKTTFPRLPNPTLVMYVFPHLAGKEQVPVPGYSTSFPLYTQPEYALPGEVPLRRQSQ